MNTFPPITQRGCLFGWSGPSARGEQAGQSTAGACWSMDMQSWSSHLHAPASAASLQCGLRRPLCKAQKLADSSGNA